jgi:adenine-specific DNA methylase
MDKPKDTLRLIEVAFPLQQASLASVHEKNVRHGHISTLHIWPARRPLAACRAALLATLLPDPGDPEQRKALLDEIGGQIVTKEVRSTDDDGTVIAEEKETLAGGVLAWGQEKDPAMGMFRAQINELYGGHAPKVLDPFAGGGAIPLEAMRLGCDVTAADLNPVAWFILKCTLDYPQQFSGKKWPLPVFVRDWPDFIEDYLAGKIKKRKGNKKRHFSDPSQPLLSQTAALHIAEDNPANVFLPDADLAWQVRAWGRWVLERAKADMASRYPVIDGEPTVAYLWARTARDKEEPFGRIPLLKTFWLCKKKGRRAAILPVTKPDRSGVEFCLLDEAFFARTGKLDETFPHLRGWEVTEDNFQDFLNKGTMTRAGVWSPCTGRPKMVALTMDDLRHQGKRGLLGTQMTAVVTEATAPNGKKTFKRYRVPTEQELKAADVEIEDLESVFAEIPFGIPDEPTPTGGGSGASRAFSLHNYGLKKWRDIFTPRQLFALGIFVKHTRKAIDEISKSKDPYAKMKAEAIGAYLSMIFDRVADRGSTICSWTVNWDKIRNTFTRFALPIVWDFCESVTTVEASGGYPGQMELVAQFVDHATSIPATAKEATIYKQSAAEKINNRLALVLTDPPYYDAIPYSDLMDFFYIWLRRIQYGFFSHIDGVFSSSLAPKWNHDTQDGELIDDESRFGGDKQASKKAYENGMAKAFQRCLDALEDNGRLVVVFANKEVVAWETLIAALIRGGAVVTASWPIQTERVERVRNVAAAALSSSVWIVCRKRNPNTPAGWEEAVLSCMREKLFAARETLGGKNILQYYFDLGIRGPDFIWAALGPALTAYSAHPFVKKMDGGYMTVPEFLSEVRRLVLQFSLGELPGFRHIQQETQGRGEGLAIDPVTQYYLLHRAYFGLELAPAGACILYANACGKSETELKLLWNIIEQGGQIKRGRPRTEHSEDTDEAGTSKGNEYRLLRWQERVQTEDLGEARAKMPAPLIDRLHRLMHLFHKNQAGELQKTFDRWGLNTERAFPPLLQAIRELALRDRQETEKQLVEALASYLKLSKRQVVVGNKVMEASLFEDNDTSLEEKG